VNRNVQRAIFEKIDQDLLEFHVDLDLIYTNTAKIKSIR